MEEVDWKAIAESNKEGDIQTAKGTDISYWAYCDSARVLVGTCLSFIYILNIL